MHTRRIGKAAVPGALLLAFCLFALAACGSNTTAGASGSGASATSTACAQATRPAAAASFKTATGIVQSVNGQTLVVQDTQGKSVTVTYTSSTKFTQEVKLAPADLKKGASIRVAVTSSNNTYTAVSVTVSDGTTTTNKGGFGNFPGFSGTPGARGGANNPCFARNRTGTNGTGNANFRGLIGTVRQVNGDVLTITDTAGASYTVTLTAQTQIVGTKSATAAVLKAGEPLTAIGKTGSNGAVAASTIAILLALPQRGGRPTATPTA